MKKLVQKSGEVGQILHGNGNTEFVTAIAIRADSLADSN